VWAVHRGLPLEITCPRLQPDADPGRRSAGDGSFRHRVAYLPGFNRHEVDGLPVVELTREAARQWTRARAWGYHWEQFLSQWSALREVELPPPVREFFGDLFDKAEDSPPGKPEVLLESARQLVPPAVWQSDRWPFRTRSQRRRTFFSTTGRIFVACYGRKWSESVSIPFLCPVCRATNQIPLPERCGGPACLVPAQR
jgi:hypothetical protein